ncbi:MAG: efflux RND transporter periplasmic adaptor subunit [Betaproteobacteria bacterium]|nr:efflux RND transporter periplasmic adaptor subunit [Betaproteobacteria bacterium]
MTGASRRIFSVGAALIALSAIGAGVYFIADGRAKESAKSSAKGGATVPVVVVSALEQSLPVRLNAIGNAEAVATVAVKARVDGQIVTVNFKEGQEVRKGEVLFRIDARPFEAALRQAEANYLRDRAQRDHARTQEKRYQELLEKNFVSKDAYAQFRTNAETAEATAKASEAALENAKLNLEYCTISSPIDGYVGRTLLQVGNLVKANDVNPLVVINQVKPIYVNFAVPEQSLPSLRQYMAAGTLPVEALSPGEPKPFAEGRVLFLDNAVDPNTGTIKIRAQFENRDARLWPGQFVNVSVRLYEQPDAILIPSRAVQTGPEGQYVYVVKPDLTAEVRRISVDRTEGDNVVVKGLGKGEQVVTRGALRLSPGAKVQIRSAADVT